MSYIQRLFDRYSNGNNPFVTVTDDGTDYTFTFRGRFGGKAKSVIYSKANEGYKGGSRTWVPSDELNARTIIFEDFVPPAPAPDPGPNLDTITSAYSTLDGYGEVDIEAAIEYVTGDELASQAPVEDNFGINDLYGLDRIGAPEAWDEGYTGNGILIAVIDTGIDRDHSELDDNIWVNQDEIPGNGIDDDANGYVDDFQGWNFVDDNNNVEDSDYHGTHVAGTIAAEAGGMVQGVAYNAKIMPLKVFPENAGAQLVDIADAIYYATNNGAHIINMSLGIRQEEETISPFSWRILRSAMKYANDNGVVVVSAAGNDNFLSPAVPGAYAVESGIVVGAVDETGNLDTNYSNRAGNAKDYENDGFEFPLYVTAAGTRIWSTVPDDTFGRLQGTSMAAPHVAAAIALLLEADPSLTPDQVRIALANTTK